MFLEIKGIKKHFGEGDSRIEVLKGMTWRLKKENYACFWDLQVLGNRHC